MKSEVKFLLALKIRAIRNYHQLTQQQFAEKLNLSRKTVSGWENSRSYPAQDFICLISKVFDVPIHYLVDDKISVKELRSYLISDYFGKKLLIYSGIFEFILTIFNYMTLINISLTFVATVLLSVNSFYIVFVVNKYFPHRLLSFRQNTYVALFLLFNMIVGFVYLMIKVQIQTDMTNQRAVEMTLAIVSIVVTGTFAVKLLITITSIVKKVR